ncbi:16S rRNA (uracil(1498)-N(3))-methyltransferase [Corynebacterium sp. USCH3]|uniref:16S rRNA (uracil(1498)-N(3))-methyltransferase n=1 Tax=Corynebacterium sp. USCH3 TaxID=3024840 RepID=UPI0030A3B82C
MTDPVFVVPDLVGQLARVGESGAFTLPGAEARHASVKRIRAGEPVVLTDGSGVGVAGRWNEDGTVAGERRIAGRDPRPRVTVVQAIPKSERAELAVDLAVQAGADRIVPWQADRCVSRWTGGKGGKSDKSAKAHARWTATAVAAMKQSRRLSGAHVGELLTDIADLPAHLAPRPWDGPADPSVRVLVLHEDAATPLAETDLDVDEVVLVIGPEGGVSDREIAVVTSGDGAQAVVLGPEVLRTATAAAVALGAIGVLTTRWGR